MGFNDLAKELNIIMGNDFGRGDATKKFLLEAIKETGIVIDGEDQQNEAPTFNQILLCCKDDDILEVYICGDNRNDKRITIEGVISSHKETIDKLKEYSIPDEEGMYLGKYRIWWD